MGIKVNSTFRNYDKISTYTKGKGGLLWIMSKGFENSGKMQT